MVKMEGGLTCVHGCTFVSLQYIIEYGSILYGDGTKRMAAQYKHMATTFTTTHTTERITAQVM